jgi:Tol biopolymer transport system component
VHDAFLVRGGEAIGDRNRILDGLPDRRKLACPGASLLAGEVSPSGRRAAVVVQSGIAEWDIWTLDQAGETPLTRVTVGRFGMHPVWEPDDATLMYSAFEDRTWKSQSCFGWLPG